MSYKWDVSTDDGYDGIVTEVVYLPLRSDLPQETLTKTITKTLQTIDSQPGSLSTYYNAITESPNTYELHTKWFSLAYHQRFMNSDIYKNFYKEVCKILDEGKEIIMFHFREVFSWMKDENVGSAGKTPAMEIATFYSKENSGFIDKAREFAARLESEGVDGCLGACVGKVLERLAPTKWLGDSVKEEKKEKGEKDKDEGYPDVVILMISWTEVEAHLRFKETEAFKNLSDILKGFDELEMHHVEFLEFRQPESNE